VEGDESWGRVKASQAWDRAERVRMRGSVLPSAFWDITGIDASSGANSELDGRNNLQTK
jgi:hypothetical protein